MKVHILFIDDNDVDTFGGIQSHLQDKMIIPTIGAMPIDFIFRWIRTAAEAVETVSKLPKDQYYILFVDFHFEQENINGMELGAQLFALRPDLPFVFMSNYDLPAMQAAIQKINPDMNYEISSKTLKENIFRAKISGILIKTVKKNKIEWRGERYVHDILCVTIEWIDHPPQANYVYLVEANGTVTRYRNTLESFTEALSFSLLATFPQVNRQTIINRLYCEKHEKPAEKRIFYLKDNTGRRTPIECSEDNVLPV